MSNITYFVDRSFQSIHMQGYLTSDGELGSWTKNGSDSNLIDFSLTFSQQGTSLATLTSQNFTGRSYINGIVATGEGLEFTQPGYFSLSNAQVKWELDAHWYCASVSTGIPCTENLTLQGATFFQPMPRPYVFAQIPEPGSLELLFLGMLLLTRLKRTLYAR